MSTSRIIISIIPSTYLLSQAAHASIGCANCPKYRIIYLLSFLGWEEEEAIGTCEEEEGANVLEVSEARVRKGFLVATSLDRSLGSIGRSCSPYVSYLVCTRPQFFEYWLRKMG